jgi:hypothetical protein
MWRGRSRPQQNDIHARRPSGYSSHWIVRDLRGETERAVVEPAEARRLSVKPNWSSIAGMRAGIGSWGVPKIRALMEATYFTGLRKAGVPEE